MKYGLHHNENFEANLLFYLQERGLTEKELGALTNYDPSTISGYKSGSRRLTDEAVERIAKVLKVKPEALFEERTKVDNEILGLSRKLNDETLPDQMRSRYSDETYSAIPVDESQRILREENAKREIGENIVSHPRVYVLIGLLTAISIAVFVFYPEVHSKIYSGIIMCGLAMLIGKSIKKRKTIDRVLDIFLWIVLILLIALFVGLGIKAALQ